VTFFVMDPAAKFRVDLAKCQGPALVSNLLLIHAAEATSG
jgi:hypothetical protein